MSTVLMHIGVGKTGTTSVQHAFSNNHVGLGPVNYPKIGQGASHNHLTALYRPYDSLARGLKKLYADPDVRDEAKRRIRDQFTSVIAEGGPLLLSEEFLSYMKQNEVSALISDLKASADDNKERPYSLRDILESYNEDALEELTVVANMQLAKSKRRRLTSFLTD